jgi:hypothetical protein
MRDSFLKKPVLEEYSLEHVAWAKKSALRSLCNALNILQPEDYFCISAVGCLNW